MTPQDPRHGTTAGFHAGCRDLCCRRALARDEKARRLDKLRGGRAVPAIGAQRRLRALMALGWSSNAIATHAGLPDRNHVLRVLNGQKGKPTTWVERKTHEWVCRVYDDLSMTVPTTPYAARTRAYATARGWSPPLAWDHIDDATEQPKGCPQGLVEDALPIRATDPDPVVVNRILAGEWRMACTPAEKAAVVERWDGSLNELGRLTGWRVSRYVRRAA